MGLGKLLPCGSGTAQQRLHQQSRVVEEDREVQWIPFLQKEVNSSPTVDWFGLTVHPELLNIHNAFYQGQYQNVIDFDTSSFSPENALPARILQLRAQIANGQAEEVLAEIEGEDTPDMSAVRLFAQCAISDSAASTVEDAEKLAKSSSENPTVQILCGSVLQANGKSEEALTLLAKHQGNLEAYVEG